MVERLRQLPQKFLEWWNKFESKQKTIIVSATLGVLVALVILVTLLTRPVYETLVVCESTKEASQIIDLLEGDGITYKTSEDGYQISVLKSQVSQANLLLGANNIPTASYDLSNVTAGGLSTTESDKQRSYKLYLEKQMEGHIEGLANVKNATVQLDIPTDNGTLIATKEEASAAIMIEPEGEFTGENAENVAKFVKTALGNTTIANITIIDNEGKLLFSGDEDYTVTGAATGQQAVKQNAENIIQSNIKKVLIGTNEYDMIEVSSKLDLDFSVVKRTSHSYTPADGQSQGVLSSEDIYNSEATGRVAGVPGTDSNGEDNTTYVIQDNQNSSSTVTEESRKYLPNEMIVEETIPAGLIKYASSSVSVAAIKYKALKEEDARTQGLLDGITWEEYKLANQQRTRIDVDESMIDLVANASGIPKESITIVAYEEPLFIDREGTSVELSDIVQIILIIVILGLLAFVILRGMKTEKVEEVEEELSVESLLQSGPAPAEIDSIEVEEKSETRKVVDKFVDENPEAAAALLRNWLNEDWN
ncbi:MAG: flagellar M-ring protein FliF [Lachnospiraceae bacterium]|nr:flagellar M-ring protein FliF [Lachnospiraceae bacterium]